MTILDNKSLFYQGVTNNMYNITNTQNKRQ